MESCCRASPTVYSIDGIVTVTFIASPNFISHMCVYVRSCFCVGYLFSAGAAVPPRPSSRLHLCCPIANTNVRAHLCHIPSIGQSTLLFFFLFFVILMYSLAPISFHLIKLLFLYNFSYLFILFLSHVYYIRYTYYLYSTSQFSLFFVCILFSFFNIVLFFLFCAHLLIFFFLFCVYSLIFHIRLLLGLQLINIIQNLLRFSQR